MITPFKSPTCVTGGLDIGARSVRMAVLSHAGGESTVAAKAMVEILGGRDVHDVRTAIRQSWRQALREASLSERDVDNVASTGSSARPVVRVGRFYGHSIQALGARLLFPDATVALEVEANQIRCVLLRDPSGRMRRVECDDQPPGELASRAVVHLDEPSASSGGAPPPECLVTRAAILVGSLATGGRVVLTGETVLDTGFVQRLWSRLLALQSNVSLLISPEATYAGACGAAILAARRFTRISRSSVPAFTVPLIARLPDRGDRWLN